MATYWSISYLLRPILFLASEKLSLETVIYDERIAQNENIFYSVMFTINLGCFVFCLPLLINLINTKRYKLEKIEISDNENDLRLLTWAVFLGWVSIFFEFSSLRNPITKSLVLLIPISLSAALWEALKPTVQIRKFALVIILGTLGDLVLAVANNNSKGFVLTPLIVFMSSLKIWRNGSSLAKFGLSIISILAAIPIFDYLQKNKLGATEILISSRFSDDLPWYLSPFLIICQRFDQFARVVDAKMAVQNSLGGFHDWILYFVSAVEWNPSSGRSDASFGQIWNQLITSQSVPGARLSQVSLAQGMIAEGIIWNGYVSLLMECAFFSLIFLVIGKLLNGNTYGVLSAFCLMSNATVFETGTIGFASILNSASKLLPFVFLTFWVLKRVSGERIETKY